MRGLIGFKSVVFAAVVATGFAASSSVVRYDSAATGTGDGSSWANAYTDIASAIAAVANAGGGEVWVKTGTHRVANGGFSLRNGVTVMGGFKGEDGADDATRDIALYESILTVAAGQYLVNQSVACDNSAVLDGCTLTGVQHAYNRNANNTQPLIRNCLFSGKAGITIRSGSNAGIDLQGCTFDNISGGAQYGTINCENGGRNSYTDCTFRNCLATSYGIIQNNVSTPFVRCRFENNRASGVGYLITYHAATYDDCTFVGNTMTNGTSLAVFSRLRNCVVASNELVNLSAVSGQSALLTSRDPQFGSAVRTPVERCSFYDNKVIRLASPSVIEGSVEAVLVHFEKTGNALVGSTFARNVCTATSHSVDVPTVGAIVAHSAANYGGVIACAFVDNACSLADVVDLGRTGGNDSLIANCLFRRANAVYTPIKGLNLDTVTKGFYVTDSVIQNYDASMFKLIDAKNVTAAEPVLYNLELAENGHLYAALRAGSDETAAVPDVTVSTGGGLYAVADRFALWTEKPTGEAEPLKDIATGEARPAGSFTCGPTQTAIEKADKLMFRARVVPAGTGEILGATDQDLAPNGTPTAVTAKALTDAIVFKGWRLAGETECFSTDETYAPPALTDDDLAVEAYFEPPKVLYTFILGDCGTFNENTQPTLVREYNIGDVPVYPAYTAKDNWRIDGWDKNLPSSVGETSITFTMRAVEKIHRIRRYDSKAADGGDGASWAKAYNSLSAAMADAGQWTGEVWIKEGLHQLTEQGGVSLAKNVAVRGGFAGVDGEYANDNAERAARDLEAHYTALQGKTTNDYVFQQTIDADATSIVDTLAITNTKYAYYSTRANTQPVFSNCWFIGRAGLFVNASGARLTVLDSRIENISGGNNWGPVHVESQSSGLFSNCRIAKCAADATYGIFDLVGASDFTNCVFEANTSSGILINAPNSTNTRFYDCRFIWNVLTTSGSDKYLVEGREFRNCSFVSNVVKQVGTSAAGDVRLLHGSAGDTPIENTTFYANEAIRDQPGLASGTVDVALIPSRNWKLSFVNCTFAENIARATVGDGATARAAILLASGANALTVRNSTFVDNVADSGDIAERDRNASNYDTLIENVVCRNGRTGYCPIQTWSGTNARVIVNSCVLPGYDKAAFGYKGGNDKVLTNSPAMCRRPVWEKGQLCYVLYKNAAYKDFCVAGPAKDIVGNPRPAGLVTPGSYQPLQPSGLLLSVR